MWYLYGLRFTTWVQVGGGSCSDLEGSSPTWEHAAVQSRAAGGEPSCEGPGHVDSGEEGLGHADLFGYKKWKGALGCIKHHVYKPLALDLQTDSQ